MDWALRCGKQRAAARAHDCTRIPRQLSPEGRRIRHATRPWNAGRVCSSSEPGLLRSGRRCTPPAVMTSQCRACISRSPGRGAQTASSADSPRRNAKNRSIGKPGRRDVVAVRGCGCRQVDAARSPWTFKTTNRHDAGDRRAVRAPTDVKREALEVDAICLPDRYLKPSPARPFFS